MGLKIIFFVLISTLTVAQETTTVRVGYMPNLTHAQPLVGLARGDFKKQLGGKVEIKPVLFNAGPSAVEALFAREIDLLYVGPNAAINAFIKSKGEAAQVIAGSASGGARLIVRKDANIKKAADFAGKKIATPQLGNTQDVAARAWLLAQGLKTTEKGGDVQIINVKNPDQLSLFQRGQIDAVWAVEPWATRLVSEANGVEFLDERSLWPHGQFATALLLVHPQFARQHPEIVHQWLTAHVQVTQWIQKNPRPAQELVNQEIRRLTGKSLEAKELLEASLHVDITDDPLAASLKTSAQEAFVQGFLGKEPPNLMGLVDLTLLNQVLRESKLETIR